jgi:hypothetical protein
MGTHPDKSPKTPSTGDKTTMRALGEFFGHVWKGISTQPGKTPQRRETRREVEEETRDTPQGKVTLRRTIIEEIELPREGEERGTNKPS